jgi:hypothetical protein
MEATIKKKLTKYALVQPLLTKIGWEAFPPIIIMASIRGTIHYPSTKRTFKNPITPIPRYTNQWKPSQKSF